MRFKTVNLEVLVAEDHVVNLGAHDIGLFKTKARDNERKHILLNAHKGADDKLHDMFVVYVAETYVRPSKHFGKDESLHIMEGAADFVFFDDDGRVIEVVPVGDYWSGRQFFCRIPEGVYHTRVIHSDMIVVHEITRGPFRQEDTLFAPWAPPEGDSAVPEFMDRLLQAVKTFPNVLRR